MNAAMPMNRLTKNTQRQDSLVTSAPPRTGPSAGATAVGIVRIDEARSRSSGGNAR